MTELTGEIIPEEREEEPLPETTESEPTGAEETAAAEPAPTVPETIPETVPVTEPDQTVAEETEAAHEEVAAPAVAGGTCGENLTWELADGVLTISGSGDMTDYAHNDLAPWCDQRLEITSVVLDSRITGIGAWAFCSLAVLPEIELPAGITRIGGYAFAGCNKLNSIVIPENVAFIGESAFEECVALKQIFFLGSVPELEYCIFNEYVTATAYYPGNDDAWTGAARQEFGGSVEWVVGGICGENLTWKLEDGVLTISGSGSMDTYSAVTEVPWNVHRDQITSVVIENGVASIGANAFNGMTGLKTVSVPGSVAAIGADAFLGCGNAEAVYGATANQWRLMGHKVKKTVCTDGTLWDFGGRGSNLAYMVLDDTLRIFGEGKMADYASGGAPWYALREKIEKLSLAEGITSIGSYAFEGCGSAMPILILPASVTTISSNAFSGWTALKHLYIPSTVATIEGAAQEESPFAYVAEDLMVYCQAASKPGTWGSYWNYNPSFGANGAAVITTWNVTRGDFDYWSTVDKTQAEIVIPEGILQIPTKALEGRDTLCTLKLPDTVTAINSNAFSGCTGLKHIYIPESVTTIRASSYTGSPFFGCSDNLEIYCNVTARARGWGSYWNHKAYGVVLTTTFSCDRSNYTYWSELDKTASSVVIPEGITLIPVKAFYNRTTLCDITIADSVTVINSNAFYGCSGLEHLFIPAGVSTIVGASSSHAPFYGCGMILYCETLMQGEKWEEYWDYGTSVKWGYTREEYEQWCELDISGSAVILPQGITSIPYGAFHGRGNLTSVMIPETVKVIGPYAFAGCTGLTDIAIPEGVETISAYAFEGCTGLLMVSIPASVTNIVDTAFYGCYNVLSYWVDEFSGSYASDDFGVLFNKDMTNLFRVPGAMTGTYEIPATVTRIESCAFDGCDGLEWIFIPASVTSINTRSFYNMSTYVNILCEVEEPPFGWVEDWNPNYRSVFYGCTGEEIEYWSKLDKTSSVIEIPEGISFIPSSAFSGCTNLTDVIIPEGVTALGVCAFSGCTGLTRIHIPASVRWMYGYIGMEPFIDCSSTLEIYCTAETTSKDWCANWNNYVGWNGGFLKAYFGYTRQDMLLWPTVDKTAANVVLPEGIESIVPEAFQGSTTLKSITIPDTVTRICSNAFSDCDSLTAITIPASVTQIGSNAFYGCDNLAITFEGTVEQWMSIVEGKSAKAVCTDGTAYAWGSCGDNLTYRLIDHKLTITGIGSMTDSSWYSPWDNFAGQIKEISLPDGLTSIGDYAFYGFRGLTSVTIPEGVTRIGSYAFNYCESLSSVTIPESVNTIGNDAFSACSSLVSVVIPEGVTAIGDATF